MALPSGTVTFAFVDVVASTAAFAEHGDAFVTALERLQTEIAACTSAEAGTVVKTEGDGAFLAFPDADSAIRTLVELQQRIETAVGPPPPVPRLRVRAGAHTGPATPVAGDYVALPVNVAARVTSAAGAGQVLVTPAVVEALKDDALASQCGEPVGAFALKDVRGPTLLYRIAGDDTPPRARAFRRTNVAEPTSTFVGRDAELTALRELVAAHRLVTVLGPGGMGKTRLTSELVLATHSAYDDGAWLVELAPVSRPDQVLGQVAGALGSTATQLEGLALDLGRRGSMLVLLDNCEHVIDGAAEVTAELLARVPDLRVLATSRAPMQIEGEHVWRIPSLAGDDTRCALFAHRFATASGSADDVLPRDDVSELCEALDGSPLAIELAAVQAREMPLPDLIALVRGGEESLARRGGGRQSSLDAVVAWSIDRLGPAEREALLVLSQVPGRLTPDEAGILLSPIGDQHRTTPTALLRGLVRVSLVDLDGQRYRLLDTIRAAARRALREDDELLPRARRMLHATAAAFVEVDGGFTLAQGENPRADRILLLEEAVLDAWTDRSPGLGEVWTTLGIVACYLPLADRLYRAAAEILREGVPSPMTSDDAYRVGGALYIIAFSGDADLAVWSPAELASFAAAVDVLPAAVAARVLHGAVGYTGHLRAWHDPAVGVVYDLAGAAAERSGSAIHRTNAEVSHSVILAELGDQERSLHHLERAMAIMPPDYLDRPLTQNNLACTLSGLGRHDEAIAVLRAALDSRPLTKMRWGLTVSLAEILLAAGAHEEAMTVARECWEELRDEPLHGPAGQMRSMLLQVTPDILLITGSDDTVS